MKKLLVFLLIAVVAYLGWLATRHSDSTELIADVHGRVTYANGKPVAGARVCQVIGSKIVGSVTSDADGRFIFRRLKPDEREFTRSYSYLVAYKKGDYLGWHVGPQWAELLPVSISNESFDIKLHRLTAVKGTVMTDKGRPVAGAHVRFDWTGPNIDDWCDESDKGIGNELAAVTGLRYRAIADERGVFRVSSLPADSRHCFIVTKPGYAVIREPDREKPAGYCYIMTVSGKVVGKVLTPSGKPVRGLSLQLSGDPLIYPQGITTSGKDGSYEIELPPGRYTFGSLSGISRGNGESEFDVKANGVLHADLTTARSTKCNSYIAGRVVDAVSGKPVPLIEISANSITTASTAHTRFTDIKGRFRIPVDAGRVDMAVGASNPFYASRLAQSMHVGLGGRRGLVLELDRSAIISGTVLDEAGSPVPGAVVSNDNFGKAIADQEGRFRISIGQELVEPEVAGASAGTKSMSNQNDDRMPRITFTAYGKQKNAAGSVVLDCQKIPSSGIKITVGKAKALLVKLKGPDGSPISGALVEAVTTQHDSSGLGVLRAAGRTNSRGEARISPVYSGSHYKLSMEAARYNDTELDLGLVKGSGPLRKVEVVMKSATN